MIPSRTPGGEVITELGQPSAEDHHVRRDSRDHSDQRLPDVASGRPQHSDGLAVPGPDQLLQRAIFQRVMRMSIILGAAIHECGGARMGNDPKMSVVNGVNQLWDVPNVFVPDAASFVSSSTVGPVLTIMTLAARASAFVAEQHAAGRLARPAEAASL